MRAESEILTFVCHPFKKMEQLLKWRRQREFSPQTTPFKDKRSNAAAKIFVLPPRKLLQQNPLIPAPADVKYTDLTANNRRLARVLKINTYVSRPRSLFTLSDRRNICPSERFFAFKRTPEPPASRRLSELRPTTGRWRRPFQMRFFSLREPKPFI